MTAIRNQEEWTDVAEYGLVEGSRAMATISTKLSGEKLGVASQRKESTMDMATKIVGPAVGGALVASFAELGAPVLVVGAVAGAALGLLKVLEDSKHHR
jgi:hypothetical protein